jgi:hypothetical protein
MGVQLMANALGSEELDAWNSSTTLTDRADLAILSGRHPKGSCLRRCASKASSDRGYKGIYMPQSAKKLLQEALDTLPDDATVEEAIERLLFLAKIEQGLAEVDAGRTMSHEEVRKRLGL